MATRRDRDGFLEAATKDSLAFERLIQAIYEGVLRHGDVVVDGGACEALHTLPMARAVGPEGTVIAVEALPHLAKTLAVRTTATPQVHVVDRALYREHTELDFYFYPADRWTSGLQRTSDAPAEVIRVETTTLDDLLRPYPAWRFGKFDLEGGELDAFRGGREAIARLRPFLVFEWSVHSPARYRYDENEMGRLLSSLDYRAYDLFGEPIGPAQWAQWWRGWYAMAVSADDEPWVRDVYPELLRKVLEKAVS